MTVAEFRLVADGITTDPKPMLTGRVNVNTADWPTLSQVPGLGPVAVDRILERRKLAKLSSYDDIIFSKKTLKSAKYLDFGGCMQNKTFLFNF